MRVLLVNSVCGIGSTGRICAELAEQFASSGDEVRIAYGRDGKVPEKYRKYAVRIGNALDVRLHGILTRLTDRHGLGSKRATKRFLRWATEYDPELLWLHNLHGYYLNYELLFTWIKSRPQMTVRWTLHDCWAFTGHCAYFSAVGCEKWETRCEHCPQKRAYPESLIFDRSSVNFDAKRQAFCGVSGMELIVPSHWLKSLVERSFLRKYSIEVRPNEVDRTVFRETAGDFRRRYHLEDMRLLLGVANVWEQRKGLADFLTLARSLPGNYRIVLVGLDGAKELPPNVLPVAHTDRPEELAEIYTAADLFLNLGVEETFGMTVLEAAACGIKSIVYEGTACAEVAAKCNGIIVPRDAEALYHAVTAYFETKGNE